MHGRAMLERLSMRVSYRHRLPFGKLGAQAAGFATMFVALLASIWNTMPKHVLRRRMHA
jgi:5-keto 4-deoxyuronate isomerase